MTDQQPAKYRYISRSEKAAVHVNMLKILDKNGWAPCELARRIGIDQSCVYRWVKGTSAPNSVSVDIMEVALGLPEGCMYDTLPRMPGEYVDDDDDDDDDYDEPAEWATRTTRTTVAPGGTGFGWIDEICQEAFEEATIDHACVRDTPQDDGLPEERAGSATNGCF